MAAFRAVLANRRAGLALSAADQEVWELQLLHTPEQRGRGPVTLPLVTAGGGGQGHQAP